MAAHSHPHTHADPPDTVGQILSAVCAVHCVATPFLLTLIPAAGSVLGGAHPVLFALVVAVAGYSFIPGYRCHRSKSVIALALLGLMLLGLSAFASWESPVLETAVSLAGAAVMMLAHWQNRKRVRAHVH
jgi:hypothetical protein